MADKIRVALVGQGISASLTPAMHEGEARAQGFDYSYELIDTATPAHQHRRLGNIVRQARDDGLAGLNITHPYKIEVLEVLSDLSDDARRLGAVNTVVFRDGRRIGHNTDFHGFVTAFKETLRGVPLDRVLVLGAGGAGAAVSFALITCGIKRLAIHDIDGAQMLALVERLRAEFPSAEVQAIESLDRGSANGLSGMVNATPMGMENYPGSAMPLNLLHAGIWVSDVVYLPLETELLAHARRLGCRIMPGSAMAIWQAVHAFELFTGRRADPQRMAATFRRLSGIELR